MPYIIWCEMFNLDVPLIDSQHKELINIVNEFHNIIKTNLDTSAIFKVLNSLIRYADKHFKEEEKLMEISNYPNDKLQEHKKIHEDLVKDIFNLHDKLNQSKEFPLLEIEMFLNDWLIKHILIDDKKLKPYLTQFKDLNSILMMKIID